MEEIRDPSEIFLIAIQTRAKDGTVGGAQCAGIEHERKLWLVPQWLDMPTEQVTMPERIISLEGLPIQPGGRWGPIEFRYILNYPIPTDVLYGENQRQQASGFDVRMHPAIKFRGLRGKLH